MKEAKKEKPVSRRKIKRAWFSSSQMFQEEKGLSNYHVMLKVHVK